MSEASEQHLRQALAAIHAIDRGKASANRVLLLTPLGGEVPFQILCNLEFERFVELIGHGVGSQRPKLTPLAQEAKYQRKPMSPMTLLAAQNEVIHTDRGGLRSSTPLRNRNEKT